MPNTNAELHSVIMVNAVRKEAHEFNTYQTVELMKDSHSVGFWGDQGVFNKAIGSLVNVSKRSMRQSRPLFSGRDIRGIIESHGSWV